MSKPSNGNPLSVSFKAPHIVDMWLDVRSGKFVIKWSNGVEDAVKKDESTVWKIRSEGKIKVIDENGNVVVAR